MTEESAVKVCVRVRPLIAREESDAVENTEPAQLYWKADKKSIYLVDDGNSTKNFSFDRVFAADETTNHLYQDIAKPLVVSTVKGYNGTIFAYGQTSSGKTFTMMGSDHIPGVIPLAVDDVFQTIKNIPKKEFLLRVSYMEIYNETVTDLLVDSWKRKPLEVREAMNKNIYVADLTEELVTSPAQALAWIRKGEKNRHYGKTKMNQRSSRSHAIFRMILESRDRSDQDSGENTDGAIIVSHLNLVDLAGSERASQTGAEGTRFKEGCNINRSLFTLGQVIKKVTDENQNGFTNYRDSKLTRILQNSLGGNAKTVIICTVTPATIDETLSTLQFASTAKKMKNDPHVTEVSDDGALLKRYRNEIVDLKRRLHEVSSVTQTTATEKEVLSQLLQEKDQLQREQEDRIKNLTKLLVTSSNLVPVQRMPKRRVTWGGKMIRLGRPSACGVTNLSFADPFSRKRKANRSCLMELGEEDEEFESNWEIPDEPTDEMETSHSSVAVRSFEDSPKDYLSPDQRRELSGKVSSLERQLEMEILQKEEAVTKVKSLDDRVAELELQLQQKLEALDKMQTTDQTTAELELQLQQKLEALDKMQTTDQTTAELELQLQQKLEALDKMQTTDQTTAELELLLQQKQEALDRMQTMDHKTAELELLLQQKQEALDRMQTTDQTTAELELLLQQKQEALDRMQTTDQKTAELELQAEAQQKQEATEKAVMLEIRVADLEKQLEEQSSAQRDTEQLKREFGETIQLCETLATEKDMVVNEREYLKQELGMFIEQTGSLEKENAALSQELEERSETEEFKSLEEEFRKEHENELKGEISNLKKTIESFELQNQELQKNLETLSEELKKKSDFAEELQSLSGKDLVQEVATLRRSLDDAEGLSRDTKKEWALLRSQNIALEETTGTLTANHDKMAAEVNGLHYQLETEKSRFRKMQGDLQKELNVVFDENTKLTTLLDGKVPKNLMDSMELERTVANLNKELTASCEAEVALRAQVEELSSFQALPAKVDNLMEQVAELTEQLCAAESQRDGLLSTQSQCQEEAQQLGDALQVSQEEILKVQADLSAAELREKELSQQWAELRSALESSDAERNLLTATCEETRLKLEVSEQHGASLEEKLSETLQLMKDLEEKLADTESSRATEEEISKELQEQLNQMAEELKVLQAEREQFASVQSSAQETETLLSTVTSLTAERDQLKVDLQGNVQMAAETQILLQTLQDDLQEAQQKNSDSDKIIEQKDSDMRSLSQQLQCVRDEKEALLMDSVQSSAEEREQQLSAVTSLTAERDQLKLDLQENVEMMIENQEELRTALEKNRELKYLIKHLETAQTSKQDSPPSETSAQQEELQTQMKTLTEELQSVRSERDTVLSESMANSQTHGEEMEKLLCSVTSLSEERDQLLETLEGLRQEKQQLRAELEDKMEMVALAHGGFNQPELQDHSEMVAHLQQEIERLQAALQTVGEQKIQLEGDLGRNMEMATEAQTLLQSLQQQLQEQNQRNIDLESLSQERQAQLEQQVNETRSLLGSLQEELQQQKQNHSDHLKLCEPRESDLAQQTKVLTEQLESARAEREALLFEKETCPLASTEDMEKLLSRVTSLTEERDQLQETLEGLRQEKQQLRAELEDRMEMMQCEQQQQFSSEPRSLKEEQEAQRLLQMQQLEEHLEESKEELSQLKSDLQENVELMIQNQEELRMSQEKIRNLQEEVDMLRSHKAELESRTSSGRDMENTLQSQELQNQIQRLTEELKVAHSEKESLLLDVRADSQTLSGEIEKLECRVGSLTEERDQLQETLEELRQEKQQLRAENEERMETLQTEVRQLSTSLHTVNEQKRQLEEDLQQNMNMVSTTQELLKSVEEELHQQKQVKSDLETLSQQKESSSEQEIRNLAETLERSKAERDSLLLEKETNCQSSTEEMEKLLSRVTALTEERDRLQETLEELRQEKQQLGAETEDRMETLQTEILTLAEKLERIEAERDVLLSERESSYHASTEEMEKLLSRVTTLSEERDRLQETLETLRQEEQQLRAELEDGMETLQTEILSLTETLNGVEAQRDGLLSEREAGHQTSTEEMEKLLSRVASLGEEKTRLQEALEGLREEKQEALEGLREEKQQLGAQLETRMEMMSAMQERLSEQELNMHQQAERGEREAKLQQELLSEANSTISALREQQGTSGVKKMASAQLQDSAAKFQELLEKFQHFIDTCSKYEPTVLAKAQRSSINLVSLPKPTAESYVESCEVGLQTVQCLNNILVHLQVHAQFSRNVFKELVKEDLALFEEKRLQDVLLCRVEAPSFSVKDGDFHSQWEHRLTEVLDKRQLYQQKMVCILEKLWANIAHFPSELLVEVREKERFKEHVQAALATQSVDYSGLDSILSRELERRTALLQSMKTTLKGVVDEHNGEVQELKQLEAQTYSQLREERSKNATLLQALEGAPLKTELSLLKDNQQLVLKVQQTEEEVKALRGQIGKLEDAQVKANNRVSNHKEATQLLQTELQDSRAQVEDKDSTIQTLRSKLRESEKNASPSAVEMEKLRSKVFKMEMELSSASDKHQQEIHRLSTLLSEKEDSLRKLKETLRKSQQQGEESFLQGEDLHARLTNPRGWKIKSSIGLEKTKLEEEVQKLQLKITELESLVSSQQAEIGKWKSRAIKLKVKKEMDKPSPPCTPIKRGLPMTSDSSNLFSSPKKFVVTPKKVLDSPRKVLDSPKKVLVSPKKNPLLDSPKSRFFDVGGSSDLLSRTCPKQFFDNSSLGTIPEVSNVPVSPDDDEEEDDSVGAHRKEEWWPQSPKQDDMCKQQ